MESAILSDDIDEEEVWLYWIDSNKEPHGKAIRHLAQEAKERAPRLIWKSLPITG